MAFNDTTLQDNQDMGAGEVIKASPFNVSAFDIFEDGLIEGRFCKYDTGSIDNLDSSDTPVIAGIARRKITGEIGTGIYSTTGQVRRCKRYQRRYCRRWQGNGGRRGRWNYFRWRRSILGTKSGWRLARSHQQVLIREKRKNET